MRKLLAVVAVLAVVGGGGAITAPSILETMNPTTKVTVKSFSVKTSKYGVGSIKKGDKYCEIKVEPRHTNILAPIPSPPSTCKHLKKGQKIKVKAGEFVSGLKR